jgi:hypothetical protein
MCLPLPFAFRRLVQRCPRKTHSPATALCSHRQMQHHLVLTFSMLVQPVYRPTLYSKTQLTAVAGTLGESDLQVSPFPMRGPQHAVCMPHSGSVWRVVASILVAGGAVPEDTQCAVDWSDSETDPDPGWNGVLSVERDTLAVHESQSVTCTGSVDEVQRGWVRLVWVVT